MIILSAFIYYHLFKILKVGTAKIVKDMLYSLMQITYIVCMTMAYMTSLSQIFNSPLGWSFLLSDH